VISHPVIMATLILGANTTYNRSIELRPLYTGYVPGLVNGKSGTPRNVRVFVLHNDIKYNMLCIRWRFFSEITVFLSLFRASGFLTACTMERACDQFHRKIDSILWNTFQSVNNLTIWTHIFNNFTRTNNNVQCIRFNIRFSRAVKRWDGSVFLKPCLAKLECFL
jgi:hypothetical protein